MSQEPTNEQIKADCVLCVTCWWSEDYQRWIAAASPIVGVAAYGATFCEAVINLDRMLKDMREKGHRT